VRPAIPRVINAVAPIRICDNGGWTDTWFARHGKVFNIAVSPLAEVQIEARDRAEGEPAVVIHAENFGHRYAPNPARKGWDHHPLLEAAVRRAALPSELAVQITIFSEAPPGASTGTSAAVAVALVGALDRLNGGRLNDHQAAYAAHSIEVDMLGRQCGIQDQLCSAHGGINYIEMTDYPQASVTRLEVEESTAWDLERRLVLVYLGRSHDSSAAHERVIRELEEAGPECRRLNDLRRTAERSRDAVGAGDLEGLGRAMIENTEAQGRLCSDLIGSDAQHVIAVARAHGARGWKVNGAGGEGGSLTLLASPRAHEKRAMIRAIEEESPLFRRIPIQLSGEGLRVWERASD
jgi:D-glycero-alpha-D-manno-heptose-7-phosphate kinase